MNKRWIIIAVGTLLGTVLLLKVLLDKEQPTPHSASSVRVDPDRVVIKELIPGDPESPPAKPGRIVRLHYEVWLLDDGQRGKKIDSSRDRNLPFELKTGTGQVMPGWDQAVEGMQVGGRREVVIPSKLAYGERGAGDLVPPNSDLLVEFEVLEIEVP
jgi:FKBP-type peptidyl-prolyl cis-trans isomerase